MKGIRIVILIFLVCFVPLSQASALTLKIGSLGPVDTPWDDAMKRLAVAWRDITGGRVTLKIYPGGIAGDESDMIRKVRIGQLDGAALSGTGLNRITSDILTLVLPLFFSGNDELTHVLENTHEDFADVMADKGFQLLGLASSGWIRFFGKEPIMSPADLQVQRLAVSAEDEEILYAWRAMGFDAIPLHTKEVLLGLQSGMAEAFHTPAIIAAIYQWFALAPNMSNIEVAPLITGLVIGEKSWRRVPEQYKEELTEASRAVMYPLYEEVMVLEADAIQIMVDNGLVINEFDDETIAQWDEIVTQGHDILVGTSITPEIYTRVKKLRDEYRANNE
ncbi:MAG: TRAP transporter substrate-binding protein DctP [Spirochaetales bacterium]|nr:TRAP transporter substrate-binding protein DctP [Spirochaetales bacterium]